MPQARGVEFYPSALEKGVRSERALKPVAIGRKNWLFAGSDNGGKTAAVLMSLCTSCKDFGVDPLAYLRDVLERVSTHPARRIEERKGVRRRREIIAGQRFSVERDGQQGELVSVKHERRVGLAGRVGPQGQASGHSRAGRVQPDIEVHAIDQEIARTIIFETDELGRVGAHMRPFNRAMRPVLWRTPSLDTTAPAYV